VACDLRELVAGVVEGLDEAGSRRVTIETDDVSPHLVFGDVPRLERVVANVLGNALKYSEGDAPVQARLARKGLDIELAVTDQGIGIPQASMSKVFDRYYRTRAGKARASGLGLGLYIARLLMEAHGGRLGVSSEVGKGSTFTLIFPSLAAAPGTRARG
jgi:signal transduction histidine kinase